VSRGFHQALHVNVWTVASNGPRPPPSISLPSHHSWS